MSPLDGRSVKEFAIMFKATLGGHTRGEASWGSRSGNCLPSGFQGPECPEGGLGQMRARGGVCPLRLIGCLPLGPGLERDL